MAGKDWLLYGAYGYTGRLTVTEALKRGEKPILSGRNAEAVQALARESGLEARPFALEDIAGATRALEGVGLVMHHAGPFSHTSREMLDHCLRAKAHYADITGEVKVMEEVFARHEEVRAAGITAVAGVGFDTLASDCVAAELKAKLPDATHLKLAIATNMKFSRGTKNSALENFGVSQVRRAGQLVDVSDRYGDFSIPFGADKPAHRAVRLQWGDLSTAYHSTGIPNIEVFMSTPRAVAALMSTIPSAMHGVVFRLWLKVVLGEHPTGGPTPQERDNAKVMIYGEVHNSEGKTAVVRHRTIDGYDYTAVSSVLAARKLLSGSVPPGALAPSVALGKDFTFQIPGTKAF